MPISLKIAIIAAHFSTYIVAAINIWIFSRRSEFYQTVVKLRSLPLIYFGFACFAISASYEIAEHIGDDWLYESQISPLNRLFYTFITAGLCLIALGLRESRILDILLVASLIAVPLTYGINDSKSLMQLISLIPAAIFVYNWYVVMRDWRVFLYLLFSNVLALGFGIALIVTGQQAFHLFVGPASAIALLILGYVTWVTPKRMS
ncbi:MAG: hypothetical protein AAF152_10015 [Cyanobacteria bacterium P01_A01_bin.114]